MSKDQQSNDEEHPQTEEGLGGGTEYPIIGEGRSKKLEQRAIRRRWNIPDDKRDQLINSQVDIAIGDGSSNREKTSAFRALLSAEAQNQADEVGIDTSMEPATPAEMLAALAGTVPEVEEEDDLPSDAIDDDRSGDTEEAV